VVNPFNDPIADTITCFLHTPLSYHSSILFRARISSLQERLIYHVVDVRFKVEVNFGCFPNSQGFIHLMLGMVR